MRPVRTVRPSAVTAPPRSRKLPTLSNSMAATGVTVTSNRWRMRCSGRRQSTSTRTARPRRANRPVIKLPEMQFSVGFEVQLTHPTVEREHQVLRESLEQAVYAEEMGFDRVWAPEHHSL